MKVRNIPGKFLILVPAALLFACASPKVEPLTDVAYAPAPTYKVQPGDVIDVKFLYSPELNEEQTVQLDGHIALSLAPDLPVQGRTLGEVRNMVMAAYAKELRDTSSVVSVKGPLQWKVYVVGEVVTPGEYISSGPPLTLTQAIARAGGLKESADSDKVVLLRRDGPVERAYGVNFHDAVNHESPSADVQLASFDVLYVPRTGVADAALYWRQYVLQFLPPNISMGFGTTIP